MDASIGSLSLFIIGSEIALFVIVMGANKDLSFWDPETCTEWK